MTIYYKNRSREPDAGDLKVLKNGKMFFRCYSLVCGCRHIVSGGGYACDWYPCDHERAEPYRKDYETKGLSLFVTSTKTKKTKTRRIRMNLRTESGKVEYERVFNKKPSEDGSVDVITVEFEQ